MQLEELTDAIPSEWQKQRKAHLSGAAYKIRSRLSCAPNETMIYTHVLNKGGRGVNPRTKRERRMV
jgi:hypothetical protein